MKKFLTMAAIALFTLTSCSDDDSEPTNPGNSDIAESTLLKKLVIQYVNHSKTMLFNYNTNNELIRIDFVNDGGHRDYTYVNNLITESRDYSGSGELQLKETYEYSNTGKLATYKLYQYGINDDAVYKTTFTYNNNETVTSTRYIGDVNAQTEWNATTVYTFSGGNIIQMNISSPNAEMINYIVTYDNKNNPYKNIPGYDVVRLSQGGVSNFNNRLTMTSDSYTSTSTYTYNEMDYPLSMTHTSSIQQDYVEQYFYE